jgi:PPOX class probable F420-dependent enzyme
VTASRARTARLLMVPLAIAPLLTNFLNAMSPAGSSVSSRQCLLLQGGAMDQEQFINFVRERGLAVIATRGADGAPQAALVGITATEQGELVFDTSRSSRKYRNLSAFAQVAMVIGWDNETTVQCEGTADIPTGADHDRCLQAYFRQYPDGVERTRDHDIVHVRVRPNWLRYSDYRPGSFVVEETTMGN